MTDRRNKEALVDLVSTVLARNAYWLAVKAAPSFLAMKFPEGEKQYVADRGHLYSEDAKAVVEALLPALSAAHEAGRLEEREAWKRFTINTIGFTHEPTGERVTIMAPSHRCFEILAENPRPEWR